MLLVKNVLSSRFWVCIACITMLACSEGDEQGFLRALEVNSKNITSVNVLSANVRVKVGDTEKFTAEGEVDGGASKIDDLGGSVTWVSSDPTIVSIDSTGLATGLTNGTVDIIASISDISGSKSLKSSDAVLTDITVSNAPASIPICQTSTQTLLAEATYADGDTAFITDKVEWLSSEPSVIYAGDQALELYSREKKGVLSGLSVGSSNITARQDGVISANSAPVSVVAGLGSIEITQSSEALYAGDSRQFTANGTYGADLSAIDITENVSWSPSAGDSTILTFSDSDKGLADALLEGDVTVAVSCDPSGQNISASLDLTVLPAPVFESIRINGGETILALDVGDSSEQLRAYVVYSNGATLEITDNDDTTWRVEEEIEGVAAEVDDDSKGLVSFSAIGITRIEVRYVGEEGNGTSTIDIDVK